MLASDVQPIGAVRERLAREMAITLAVPPHGRETFEALAELFARHRGDKPVTFQLGPEGTGRAAARARPGLGPHPRQALARLVERGGEDLWAGAPVASAMMEQKTHA